MLNRILGYLGLKKGREDLPNQPLSLGQQTLHPIELGRAATPYGTSLAVYSMLYSIVRH